jgi:CubicO group peptidase (beta-lactamase class C family)
MKINILIFLSILGLSGCDTNSEARSGTTSILDRVVSIEPTRPSLPVVASDEVLEAANTLPGLTSFMVWHSDSLQLEHYRPPMHRSRPINIKSASKTVLSALIGIAIEQGHLSSVDDSVSKYLPTYFERAPNDARQSITIQHLLTMSSGLESTSIRRYGAWVASRDWISYALNGDLDSPPGTDMSYSTGDSHILSAVLTEATGISTRTFAERYLFGPMGITIGGWDRDPRGYYFGGNNMAISPAGLLEFGKLYLYNGRYKDRQLLSPDWVRDSQTVYFERVSYNSRATITDTCGGITPSLDMNPGSHGDTADNLYFIFQSLRL